MHAEPDDASRIEALESALARAQAASLAKDDFLTSISHELRDPLNAVLGFAHLLVRHALSPRSQAHVEHILKCGQHLVRLVDDIHDISRIEFSRARQHYACVSPTPESAFPSRSKRVFFARSNGPVKSAAPFPERVSG
jgi:signal transduction histidine kinase